MKHLLKQFTQREANPYIQFIKYGIGGLLATVADVILFSFLAWKVFPALKDGELVVRFFQLDVPEMSPGMRSVNFAICKSISFPPGT